MEKVVSNRVAPEKPSIDQSFLARTQKSLRIRADLIFSALFRRGNHLPSANLRNVQSSYGWANLFDFFPQLKTWQEKPNPDFHTLSRAEDENIESSEPDVIILLYNLVRLLRAKRVIEVGVYRGAGSLHLAQGLADNGGGELHLVDISLENLADVEKKIQKANLSVVTSVYCGDSAVIAKEGNLPSADLIFLDADHQYGAVKQDIAFYLPLVSENGLLVLHDAVLHNGVRLSSNELFADGYKLCTIATSGGSGISIVCKQSTMENENYA